MWRCVYGGVCVCVEVCVCVCGDVCVCGGWGGEGVSEYPLGIPVLAV